MSHGPGIVIVGGSLAGVTAADALRLGGYTGAITVVGAEPYTAYARPPLSKEVLKGIATDESVMLPPLGDDVAVRTGARAVGLDPVAREVALADGSRVPYEKLAIATGTRPRVLGTQPTQYVLRDIGDADRLRTALRSAQSLLVVGGGFLGMEIASVGREMGLEVTVVDIRPPLVGVLGDFLGGLFGRAARDHGVRLMVCPGGVRLVGDGEFPTGVRTSDGRLVEADVVVTAVGDEPNSEWLQASGTELSGPGWVSVDDHCRVTLHGAASGDIVAAGDITVLPTSRGMRRMPHWDNAIAQAKVAADTLLGKIGRPYVPEPYFWTEAFGIAVKIAGWLPAAGAPEVVSGSLADRSALLRWDDPNGCVVAALNYRIPVGKLRRLARPAAVSRPA